MDLTTVGVRRNLRQPGVLTLNYRPAAHLGFEPRSPEPRSGVRATGLVGNLYLGLLGIVMRRATVRYAHASMNIIVMTIFILYDDLILMSNRSPYGSASSRRSVPRSLRSHESSVSEYCRLCDMTLACSRAASSWLRR